MSTTRTRRYVKSLWDAAQPPAQQIGGVLPDLDHLSEDVEALKRMVLAFSTIEEKAKVKRPVLGDYPFDGTGVPDGWFDTAPQFAAREKRGYNCAL
jgi:hypothetical protein